MVLSYNVVDPNLFHRSRLFSEISEPDSAPCPSGRTSISIYLTLLTSCVRVFRPAPQELFRPHDRSDLRVTPRHLPKHQTSDLTCRAGTPYSCVDFVDVLHVLPTANPCMIVAEPPHPMSYKSKLNPKLPCEWVHQTMMADYDGVTVPSDQQHKIVIEPH